MGELVTFVEGNVAGWPAVALLALAVVREALRVIGLVIVLRGTTPGDRSTVLRAYGRRRGRSS